MSRHAGIKMWLGYRHVCHLAEVFGLPAPHAEKGEDWIVVLTAQEVKQWIEFDPVGAGGDRLVGVYLKDAVMQIADLYHVQRLMAEHARHYISDVTHKADMLERTGELRGHWDRKGYFRRATKLYRMVFA